MGVNFSPFLRRPVRLLEVCGSFISFISFDNIYKSVSFLFDCRLRKSNRVGYFLLSVAGSPFGERS